jgi:DNA mismatch repair protein MutL
VVPQEVALPPALADLLAARRRELAAVGLALTPAATGRIVVSAAPPMLDGADLQAVLIALGSGLPTGSRGVGAGWRDHVLATIACHSSIRPGQALSFAEMQKLLEELQQCATPEVCPHGHAVMATITTTWLEQQFDRSGQEPRERQEGAGVRMTRV